jgi:DNA repair protein RAD50
VRRLNDLQDNRAEQKEQVERLQSKLQGLVMTLLMNDDVRAVIPDVEVTGVGMQQAREAPRKGVGVIDIDENEEGGGGSKRRRVTLDADAAFARAVKAFHDNLTEHKIAKARLEGEAKTMTEGLKVDRVRMTSAELKNCDTEYSTALTEATVLEAAVRDLDLYYSALDKALMRYHALKIAEINSSIAELWSLTYKGTDIEKIEIKSDMSDVGEDGAVIPVAPTTGRTSKSYNYRVVMTKSGRELDMRGRCSAGQKVLASIVIRLALAESFCVSTGILALDEPTTNLDAPNKRGLAMALSRIIDARKADNLQLIIITHDEDFVKEMGRAGKEGGGSSSENQMGKYYRVFRQDVSGGVYHSRIEVLDDTE